MPKWNRFFFLSCLTFAVSTFSIGCGDDDDNNPSTPPTHFAAIFSTEGERLNAYDPNDHFRKQAVVTGGEDEHAGALSLNGQVCFDPTSPRRFAVADDAGQPAVTPGWSILRLNGNGVGNFSVTRLAKIEPTFQQDPDPYGCTFLSGGRLLTTDIGANAAGPGDGQLILWFPPLDAKPPRYCKLDIQIATAQQIYVDSTQRIYVASARDPGGIYRYSGAVPTSPDAAGGCGGHDATGAPLADGFARERFIRADSHAQTPNGIVGTKHGTFYVGSILNGVIAEYDAGGHFVREILRPPMGERLGPQPYSTGTPLGITVDSAGSLYYADLGLIADGLDIGPGHLLGTVRRIRFDANGQPQAPEKFDQGLAFPDGVGVLEE